MYNIVYKPRTVIKAHTLSNFVAEWIETQTPQRKRARVLEHQLQWILTTSRCRGRNTGNIS
jgi:hypothetical protein